jgi:hypothetical protein
MDYGTKKHYPKRDPAIKTTIHSDTMRDNWIRHRAEATMMDFSIPRPKETEKMTVVRDLEGDTVDEDKRQCNEDIDPC